MRYLLDTHVFLWWILGDLRLPPAVVDAVNRASENVLISVASLWEMAIKVKLGKMQLPEEPFDKFILGEIQKNRIDILTIHAPHVFETARLPSHHNDPFDRLLVAQARVESLTLVTKDQALRAYDVPILW